MHLLLALLLAFALAACGSESPGDGSSSTGGDGDGDGDGDGSPDARAYCERACACEGFEGDDDCLAACVGDGEPSDGCSYDAYWACLADDFDCGDEPAEICADELADAC